MTVKKEKEKTFFFWACLPFNSSQEGLRQISCLSKITTSQCKTENLLETSSVSLIQGHSRQSARQMWREWRFTHLICTSLGRRCRENAAQHCGCVATAFCSQDFSLKNYIKLKHLPQQKERKQRKNYASLTFSCYRGHNCCTSFSFIAEIS